MWYKIAVNGSLIGTHVLLTAEFNQKIIHVMAKENSAFMQPMKLSADLEAVVGKGPMPRSEVVSKIWMYIKGDQYEDENGKKGTDLRKGPSLQDAKDKRIINTDEALKKIFGGQDTVHMMKMAGFISKHVSK